jgi:tetratricopeptide (TPR) repeat protein
MTTQEMIGAIAGRDQPGQPISVAANLRRPVERYGRLVTEGRGGSSAARRRRPVVGNRATDPAWQSSPAVPLDLALGLLAEANARSIGLHEYQQAIALYEAASAIYAREDLPVEQARSQIGKVGALSFLGRYAEASQTGQWASQILEAHGQWQPLATLTMNLAVVHATMGEDAQALGLFDRAGEIYAELGEAGRAGWLWVQLNRALVLRNLGQFEASIAACRTAQEELAAMGQTVAAARARWNLALTHFILGQYNEALNGFDQVREVFAADGRQRDAMLVDLDVSNCLLQLRQYHGVLETCRQVRSTFSELGAHDVAAKAIVIEGWPLPASASTTRPSAPWKRRGHLRPDRQPGMDRRGRAGDRRGTALLRPARAEPGDSAALQRDLPPAPVAGRGSARSTGGSTRGAAPGACP